MDAVKEFLTSNAKSIAVGTSVVGATVLFLRFRKNKRYSRVCGVDYPRDKVIVQQFFKGACAPSMGHFVMKLETYLRIAKIPYEPAFDREMGPKNKIPWIEYNGTTMGDSQLIINFLNKEFNVNLNKSLNAEQRAIAWAIQKWLEEFTYHLNVYTKWVLLFDDMGPYIPNIPKIMTYGLKGLKGAVQKMQYTIGIGRHTKQEVYDMIVFDLRQLSAILGTKKYLMGGDEPMEVDCAAFGILCQIRYSTPDSCPGKQAIAGELTNLRDYIDRLKNLYWPDWEDRLDKK